VAVLRAALLVIRDVDEIAVFTRAPCAVRLALLRALETRDHTFALIDLEAARSLLSFMTGDGWASSVAKLTTQPASTGTLLITRAGPNAQGHHAERQQDQKKVLHSATFASLIALAAAGTRRWMRFDHRVPLPSGARGQ